MESDPHVLVLLVAGGTEEIVSANPSALGAVGNAGESHHTLPVLVTSAAGSNLVTESTRQLVPNFVTESRGQLVSNLVDNHIYHAVLDAIAGISISEDSGQAVAVALEIDVAKQVAILTIAINHGDASSLVAYLNGIWRLLSIISTRWETLRQAIKQTGLYSAPSSEDVEPWRTEFIKRIYRYCLVNRLGHYKRENVRVRQFVSDWRHSEELLWRKFEDALHCLHVTDKFLTDMTSGGIMTDQKWGNLICLMDGTVVDIEKLLDTCSCEEWAKSSQLQNGQISPYPLRSTLETLISQHRHIRNLLRFAQSPGSRPALLSKIKIRVMPRHPDISVVLPTSQVCWQSLIESVCADNVIANYTWLEQQVTKFLSTYRYKNKYSLTVHGPCALIAYLETAHSTSQPPLGYIGVSSKTCSACHTWIQAFNAVGGHQYSTRGTSGHWRRLWGMPELLSVSQRAQVTARMARLVTATYVDFWTSKGKLYHAGGIPDGTGRGADSAPALDPAERRQALINSERNRVACYGW